MILDDFISLPRLMFEQSGLSMTDLAKLSGIGYDRLNDIIVGNQIPTFDDVVLIKEAIGLTDDMVADIMNKTKERCCLQ